MKIAMLSTGEEVLHGDIVDTNAAWLSSVMYEQGFALTKRSTVGDQMNALVEELLMLSFNNDVVIVNGGLGPTTDDMSSAAAAKAAECKIVLFKEWLTRMEEMYRERNRPMPDSNLKQAMLPETAEIVDNPIGTACGFKMNINEAVFYFTPGVPREFKVMVETQILPDLKKQWPDNEAFQCSRLYTFGLSESGISDKLDALKLPQGYELGYRSSLPFIEVKLFGPKDALDERVKVMQLIYKLLEGNVVSVDESMTQHIGHMLKEKGLTLATAEQSSFGYLASWLQSDDNIAEQSGHAWVLSAKGSESIDNSNPLAAVFALAGATREKCSTDLALVTGKLNRKQFSVALSAHGGEWGMVLELNRVYGKEDASRVISTVAADLLRRYLEKKPMFGEYFSVTKVKEMFVPSSLVK
ncbi:CinA family nicotinamide mononucleotide deamidase-related protein [Vibrio vulnificus]|uniref:CinA family nicotinamide mononucleotide deamidase-related protein n=1 Tax=Vibrio vulnificus TaxID=672 RepID=UPI001A18AA58|nr:CinA family nicotinamide mononucleotide deamidase-related protein [Vibrio vulnificus]EGQ9975054.1 CinA family nicotinamide mononucleotide deamidase-related protein [Vibrio vulnificus]MDS1839813.1 CinA family nicotinamide mononucleotide deamidase-related protein [Vibrio vulnificus]MDS1848433.1 CinA family nicotinamide mononucleotide deamidase-related protein [Vibrio vulnificus]HAS8109953.1 CinA family nicotinamide mononucleotide deamidase-related protein [Vibrio vulnificus]HAS8125798.1 CinA 